MNSTKKVLILLILIVAHGASAKAGNAASDLLPGIRAFLENHKEFGAPTRTQPVPDWAQGKPQRVQFASGRNLLFYLKEGTVLSVYEDLPGKDRKKIWGEYASPPPDTLKDKHREADEAIPAYTIIQSMNLARGGKHADVLIPTFSRDTPRETRQLIAFELLKKEGLTGVSLFSTRDACKAQYSASFAETHPDASKGFLGQISPGSTEFIDLQ